MIIFGSRNYYKRDSSYRSDICQNCGYDGYLHSYSTTSCGHIYWIPLIPYANKRILDQCPNCEAGRELSVGEWKKIRNNDLGPAIRELRQNPSSKEAAEKAVALATLVGSKREFTKIVGLIAGHHKNDAELIGQLGRSFHYFGMPEEGNQALQQSLHLKEDEDLRKLLEYRQNRNPGAPPSPPSKIGQLIPVLIAPFIALFAFGAFLAANVTGKPERVFLVNGLELPYEASINGTPVNVAPMSQVRLDVEYGPFSVDPVPGSLPFEPYSAAVEAGTFERSGEGPVVVVNPDRAAAIYEEEVIYIAENSGINPDSLENKFTFFVGEPLYTFKNIDAAFTLLPENITMPTNASRTTKSVIDQVTELEPIGIVSAIMDNGQPEEAVTFLRSVLSRDASDESLLVAFTALSEPEEAIEFLESRLHERPVDVNWHRYFQNLVKEYRPENALVKQYRELSAKESGNSDLLYLLGRVIDDNEESFAIYQQSTEGPKPSAYGFHAIAYHHMQRGSYAEALSAERSALQLDADNETFQRFEEGVLEALQNYDELVPRVRKKYTADNTDQSAALQLAFFLSAAGRPEHAEQIRNEYLNAIKPLDGYSKEVADNLRDVFDSSIAEASGDLTKFSTVSARIGEGEWLYYTNLAKGDYEAALKSLRDAEMDNYFQQLLLYALASSTGNNLFASDRLKDAIGMLESGGTSGQTIATWFAPSASAPTIDEVYEIALMPDHSRTILSALAIRHPEAQARFAGIARKMNYNPAFPGMFLEKLLASLTPASPSPLRQEP